jgi:hypothetical protein
MRIPVIDKLDSGIPSKTSFHPEFQRLYREIRGTSIDPFHRSKLYEYSADLQPFGYDAILHMYSRFGKRDRHLRPTGDHKLELVDTGRKSFSHLVNEIERIFEFDALEARVMRLDLAADIEGISVSWFQERIKATYKRCLASIGSTRFIEMGKGGIQTLYFGKRPNLFRIYDKVEEYRVQYEKLLKNWRCEEPVPTFEEFCSIPETGHVLTRVERQLGGAGIPEQLKKVRDLKQLENFRPFDRLMIVDGGQPEPHPDHYSFMEFCTGMYLREMAQKQGMHATLQFMTRKSNRNAAWARAKFRDFLPTEDENEMVNTDFLNEVFRRSVIRQLAASKWSRPSITSITCAKKS